MGSFLQNYVDRPIKKSKGESLFDFIMGVFVLVIVGCGTGLILGFTFYTVGKLFRMCH